MNALDFLSLCGNNYDITLTIMLRDWRGEHTGRFREIFHYVLTQVDKNDDIMSWKMFSYDKETKANISKTSRRGKKGGKIR